MLKLNDGISEIDLKELLLEMEEKYLASRVENKDARALQGWIATGELDLFYPSILEKMQNIITEMGVDRFLKKYVTKTGEVLIENETHTLIIVPDLYKDVVLRSFPNTKSPYDTDIEADSEWENSAEMSLYFIKIATILEKVNGKFNMSSKEGRYLQVQKSVQTGYATIIKQLH